MARPKNDGRGRIGGRQRGTPNRPKPTTIKEWIQQLIDSCRNQLCEDFKTLDPEERLQLLIKLLPYVAHKVTAPVVYCAPLLDANKEDDTFDA